MNLLWKIGGERNYKSIISLQTTYKSIEHRLLTKLRLKVKEWNIVQTLYNAEQEKDGIMKCGPELFKSKSLLKVKLFVLRK